MQSILRWIAYITVIAFIFGVSSIPKDNCIYWPLMFSVLCSAFWIVVVANFEIKGRETFFEK